METDMVRVDTKLFITCRLCLEDEGMYQINPAVQSQIKYSFDIDVDPFDSLPQLICNKCKDILSDYVTTKRTFVGKQNALRARMEVRKGLVEHSQSAASSLSKQPQQGEVSSSQDAPGLASADEVRSRSTSPSPKKKKKFSKRGPRNRKQPWEDDFVKSFVCRICNKRLVNQGNVMRHVKHVHGRLLEHHKRLFLRSCSVNLERVDEKQNFINSLNVVMKPNKVVADRSNTLYHVLYTRGVSTDEEDEQKTDSESSSAKLQLKTHSESSSEELQQNAHSESSSDEILIKRPHSKRLRLLSKSSTDTVCLDDVDKEIIKRETPSHVKDSDTPHLTQFKVVEECINIDDSSDSDHGSTMSAMDGTNTIDPKSLSISVRDYNTIQRIVASCESKYVKKIAQDLDENAATNSDFNINNKIMNVGRKVINNSGVSCKALLRYLENKNLELEWSSIIGDSLHNKEGYVRIMPKLRSKKLDDEKQGWKFTSTEGNEETSNEECALFSVPKKAAKMAAVATNGPTFHVDTLLKEAIQKDATKEVAEVQLIDKNANKRAALHPDNESNKILLNASPVVNPKRLPKKACPKSAKPKVNNEEYSSKTVVYDNLTIAAITHEEGLSMPIITSTTSLAPQTHSEPTEVVTCEPPTTEAETNADFNASNNTEQQNYDLLPELHMPIVAEAVETSGSNVETSGRHVENSGSNVETSGSNVEPNESNVEPNKSNVEPNKSNVEPKQRDVEPNEILPSSSENAAPRIKVKPVSELMTQSALNNLNSHPRVTSQNTWSANNQYAAAPAPLAQETFQRRTLQEAIQRPTPTLPNPNNQVLTSSVYPLNSGAQENQYMILDTVQFPNRRTYSPFIYIKDLLQVHNITLLDDLSQLNKDFQCLLKFKVQFAHDPATNRVPVVLVVSLHILVNHLFIGVRGSKQDGDFYSLSSLSAVWQWEVVKMLTTRDDVKAKLLQNASGYGNTVVEYANTFLCVLRSIKIISSSFRS